jgi:hypothetical protein
LLQLFSLYISPPNKSKKLKSGSPLTLAKLTARSPATFYGAKSLKSEKVATPAKGGKAANAPKSLLKEVLLNNQRAAATPKMTPRGQIRLLAVKTPRSVKGTGARRPLWSEVAAKNKDKQQPVQVRLHSLPGTGTVIHYHMI